MKNYYEILQVLSNATDAEIKKNYREIAKLIHPDKCGGNEYAAEMFKSLNEAYAVLIDPLKRKLHDTSLQKIANSDAASPINNAMRAKANAAPMHYPDFTKMKPNEALIYLAIMLLLKKKSA